MSKVIEPVGGKAVQLSLVFCTSSVHRLGQSTELCKHSGE